MPLRAAIVALCGIFLTACTAPQASGPIGEIVTVAQGDLAGVADGSVLRWQGIPYAAAPVGEGRFRPPQQAPEWDGTRPATAPGARCPQTLPDPSGLGQVLAERVSEDCLTLSVTAPSGLAAGDRLPVLVWLHGERSLSEQADDGGGPAGAGFDSGTAGDLDPRRLVEAGLVVVTVEYRLGMLGFFGLPGMDGAGELGLMDQQAALRWVQHNIVAFGGDPDNVTLGGSGSGADSACAHVTSPHAVGLFEKLILQSSSCGGANLGDVISPGTGPAGDIWKPAPLVADAGVTTAADLGCPSPPPARFDTGAVLRCLRALPVETLLDQDYHWTPATGTGTLPRPPSEVLLDADLLHGFPVLAGTTGDEGTVFADAHYAQAGIPLNETGVRQLLDFVGGARAAEVGAAYPLGERSPDRVWADLITDRAFACPAVPLYAALAPMAPLYAYEFAVADTAAPPGVSPDLAGGTPRGSELPYLFDRLGAPALPADREAMAAELVDRWARFVATGNPNGGGGTPWPAWAGAGEILTITGAGPGTTVHPAAVFRAAHHCDLWGIS